MINLNSGDENRQIKAIPLNISVIVSVQNNKPCVILRSNYADLNTIKQIITATWHGVPIILMPSFTNRIRSIASLIEKGIIYEKDGLYYFNF